jgi:hypothetical protein
LAKQSGCGFSRNSCELQGDKPPFEQANINGMAVLAKAEATLLTAEAESTY